MQDRRLSFGEQVDLAVAILGHGREVALGQHPPGQRCRHRVDVGGVRRAHVV